MFQSNSIIQINTHTVKLLINFNDSLYLNSYYSDFDSALDNFSSKSFKCLFLYTSTFDPYPSY